MSVLEHLYLSEELSTKVIICSSVLRMCVGIGKVGAHESVNPLGRRPQTSVVTAVGQCLIAEFYVIGPLFIQYTRTENMLSTQSCGTCKGAHSLTAALDSSDSCMRELFQSRVVGCLGEMGM